MAPRAVKNFSRRGDPCRPVSAHCLTGTKTRSRDVTAQGINKERLFNAAAELTDPAQRAAFLDTACGGDTSLRAEIEELLRHDEAAAGFLSSPALAADASADVKPPPA